MRESKIEGYLRKEIAKLGGWMEKHVSPGTKGPPDNGVYWPAFSSQTNQVLGLDWLPIPATEWIETKAPLKGPTVLQARDHARRRAMGFIVHVISTMEAAEVYLRSRGKK